MVPHEEGSGLVGNSGSFFRQSNAYRTCEWLPALQLTPLVHNGFQSSYEGKDTN